MRRAPLLLCAILLAGCLEDAGGGGPAVEGTPVAFRTLARDTDSGHASPQRTVLGTQEAYEAAWARHASGANPKGDPPAVDFTRERVVLVALGEKGSGCHGIRVENVTRTDRAVTVHVGKFDGEGADRSCTAVMVQPIHFVAIASTSGDVEFRERTVGPGEAWPPVEPGGAAGGEAEPLSARTLARGSFSNVQEDTRLLLRDAAAWEALWARHGGEGAAPEVSFPNESVVAVIEHGPTGCFGVHVGNVTYDSAARVLLVEVVHERTPSDVSCIQALQDAYHFVAIPDRAGEARFVDVEGEPRDEPPAPNQPPGGGESPFAFRTLAAGTSSAIDEELRRVVRDEDAWAALWAEHTANVEPRPERPSVDFAEEHVFVATAGPRANLCWDIRVEAIRVGGDSVHVQVTTFSPEPGMVCAQAVSRPYHFVTYPVTELPAVVAEGQAQGRPPSD